MDYYSFIIDGEKVGYYEVEDRDGILYQNAFMTMNGDSFENPFWVKHQNGKITAYRFGDEDWVNLSTFPANTYPTSAFELLAKRLADGEVFEHGRINEGKGIVTGTARLERKGNTVRELVDGKSGRYLMLDESNAVTEYGWGGSAKSVKVANKTEALEGTTFKN